MYYQGCITIAVALIFKRVACCVLRIQWIFRGRQDVVTTMFSLCQSVNFSRSVILFLTFKDV